MAERTRGARAVSVARAARAALARVLGGGADFVVRVWNKAGQDDVFFLAGAIAFNVLVAAVPFLLLLVAVFGFVLKAAVDDPQRAAVDYVFTILPPSQGVRRLTTRIVDDVVQGRAQFGVLGLALFVWSSTRLFGSLRSTLREVFDLQEERGIVAGKIFDFQMVIVAGTLFLANTGITILLEGVRAFGTEWLADHGWRILPAAEQAWARVLAFGFIFVMYLLIYRYLPYRRIRWRTALVAATFTALAWELLKGLFAWYVTYVANYTTTYGALATLVILVFWIYYSAVVFILGGEVGQVYDLLRTRRKQRELLE